MEDNSQQKYKSVSNRNVWKKYLKSHTILHAGSCFDPFRRNKEKGLHISASRIMKHIYRLIKAKFYRYFIINNLQMFKTALFTTLALFGLTQAGISTGKCSPPTLQQNFDAVKYTGLWHEQARDETMPWESNDCQQARYGLNADGTVSVHNSQYNPTTDQIEDAKATAVFDGAQGKVSFFSWAPAGDYRVLATDYENFALVYSCENYYLAKTEYIWVLTRSQIVDQSVVSKVLSILSEKVPDYDQTQVRRTLQGDAHKCKYLSEGVKASVFLQ